MQRRNQKVVERAPAPYLTEAQRAEVCEMGRRICAHVDYECAGTVEFLMDMDDEQVLLHRGEPARAGRAYRHRGGDRHRHRAGADPDRRGQDAGRGDRRRRARASVKLNGHALQCRVTTEDPLNNFIPDYGRLTAYRSATGNGIRLDGGTAYAGGVITRYYDSLLVKVTAHAQTPEKAIARMDRALREFRIRGVATNIEFVINLLKHPTFLDDTYTTKFIDTTPDAVRLQEAARPGDQDPDLYRRHHRERPSRDGGPRRSPRPRRAHRKPPALLAEPAMGTRNLLEQKGPQAVADWMQAQKKVLITDTTMRDGHQSLLATRMRSIDMIKVAPAYAANLPQLFSVECWGGATFDVAYRFLQECPWQRLRDLRAAMPNLMTQMLLRASNGVGYTNYPDNVVQVFRQDRRPKPASMCSACSTASTGSRTCASRWMRWSRPSKVCEGTICYTGDMLDPDAGEV